MTLGSPKEFLDNIPLFRTCLILFLEFLFRMFPRPNDTYTRIRIHRLRNSRLSATYQSGRCTHHPSENRERIRMRENQYPNPVPD